MKGNMTVGDENKYFQAVNIDLQLDMVFWLGV